MVDDTHHIDSVEVVAPWTITIHLRVPAHPDDGNLAGWIASGGERTGPAV
jgi:hypothetical protein